MVLWGRSVLGRQKVPRKVPPRFRQGSTKVSPRFHQVSPSFVVSLVLWGRSVLGCQKVRGRFHQGLAKVPPRFHQVSSLGQIRLGLPRGLMGCQKVLRFHQGFTEVPPRFHEGCASFVISLVFWGRSLSFPKGSAEGPPITSLYLSPSSFNSFLHLSEQS